MFPILFPPDHSHRGAWERLMEKKKVRGIGNSVTEWKYEYHNSFLLPRNCKQ